MTRQEVIASQQAGLEEIRILETAREPSCATWPRE
jgi:hypothetical protein